MTERITIGALAQELAAEHGDTLNDATHVLIQLARIIQVNMNHAVNAVVVELTDSQADFLRKQYPAIDKSWRTGRQIDRFDLSRPRSAGEVVVDGVVRAVVSVPIAVQVPPEFAQVLDKAARAAGVTPAELVVELVTEALTRFAAKSPAEVLLAGGLLLRQVGGRRPGRGNPDRHATDE